EKLDTTTAGGMFVFHVFAALAEFIRELIVEGTYEGLDAARSPIHPELAEALEPILGDTYHLVVFQEPPGRWSRTSPSTGGAAGDDGAARGGSAALDRPGAAPRPDLGALEAEAEADAWYRGEL
ncbi:MAG: resolvase, partial [Nonomuraea muscovyensis]|nr:resolvase [Nonomuraea muscovyensis]